MPRFAPRLDDRLVAAIACFDDRRRPIAETNRRIGALAESLGLARPSYEEVRRMVHLLREREGGWSPLGDVLLDVAFRVSPPEAILDHLTGTRPARRRS